MHVGSFQTCVCMWVVFRQVYAYGYFFQTGVCMSVQFSDMCTLMNTVFIQLFDYKYSFQKGVCMWVVLRQVYGCG